MPTILFIETATQVCSVAVSTSNGTVFKKEASGQNLHAENLTLFIEEVMRNAELKFDMLDAVAISKGPGSYTGLRIGTSTAKGLCFALDIPLIAINTLEMMAAGFIEQNPQYSGLVCPMIDARRMEVYSAVFDENLNNVVPTEAKIIEEDSFDKLLSSNQITFIGDGAIKCEGIIRSENATFSTGNFNSAAYMLERGTEAFNDKKFEDVAYFEPFYLKDFVVTKSKKTLL